MSRMASKEQLRLAGLENEADIEMPDTGSSHSVCGSDGSDSPAGGAVLEGARRTCIRVPALILSNKRDTRLSTGCRALCRFKCQQ
jgi:hypothetical protein